MVFSFLFKMFHKLLKNKTMYSNCNVLYLGIKTEIWRYFSTLLLPPLLLPLNPTLSLLVDRGHHSYISACTFSNDSHKYSSIRLGTLRLRLCIVFGTSLDNATGTDLDLLQPGHAHQTNNPICGPFYLVSPLEGRIA